MLCEKRSSVDELVREFYANLTSSTSTKVFVQEIKAEKLQEILQVLTISCSKWIVLKHGTHTCHREYLTPLAKVWF